MIYSSELLKDIIQWDVKTWGQALSFWDNHINFHEGMKALTIGEREGGLSLWLASNGLQVLCTEYNEFPDATKKIHDNYKLDHKISYEEGVDITDLSRYPSDSFDIVAFKSVIGALSKKHQLKVFSEIRRILKPGGRLVFAENLKGSKLHVLLRKKFVSWNYYWNYLDYKKDQNFYSEFRKTKFKTVGFFATFGRSEKQRSILSVIDKVIQPFLPPYLNYVLIGVLVK